MSQPAQTRNRQKIVLPSSALIVLTTLALLFIPGAVLAGTCSISGTVVGPSDKAVSGYRVQILEGDIVRASSELTGRRGAFQLRSVPLTSYEVQVVDEHGTVCGRRQPAFELHEGTELHLMIRLDDHPCTGTGISLANQARGAASRLGAKKWWLFGLGGAAAIAALASSSESSEPPVSPSAP